MFSFTLIYMRIIYPTHISVCYSGEMALVCNLKKWLYGLKQYLRASKLSFVLQFGMFKSIKNFIIPITLGHMSFVLSIWMISSLLVMILQESQHQKHTFTVNFNDLGNLPHFHNKKIVQLGGKIYVSQCLKGSIYLICSRMMVCEE